MTNNSINHYVICVEHLRSELHKKAEMTECLLVENSELRVENAMLRERLEDIWQGLQTICGDVRAAIRESSND